MTEALSVPVAESWARIDAWLAAHAPASAARLNPGADPAALAAAERVLGIPLPADLAASLACHNGADPDVEVLPDLMLLPIDGVVEQWELRNQVEAEFRDDEDEDDEALAPLEHPYWDRLWIPVAHFQGDLDVIDMRPGPGHGRLGWSGHDGSGSFGDGTWPSFGAWLAAVAHVLMTGEAAPGVPRPFDDPYVSPGGELLWGWLPTGGLRGTAEENGYRRAPVGLPG
ncbi:SMI1/KNR4 family protein [Streptomyces radicis]|uniref:Knr4/Smi1-like domain-containing protein n=1 Tax=Streptomyces radicis TaxID=1750517 RepID=A0A3A9W193_9ACTN|nr:SMI1/KNR4 family protein [Streptomyces radicis]RKN06995.1 hypothetical protein D7319_20055 [Streptomyces radicis]RKN15865.1 hypothetical protein D7318_26740 [Streptomyces radicis]